VKSEFKITGLEELKKQLEALPANIEKNVTRGALRAGVKVFQARAKELVPVKSGALRDSIKIRAKVNKKTGYLNVKLVVGDKKAWYANMVEGGTIAHLIKPKKRKSLFIAGIMRELVEHPGAHMQPFMRPAFDQTQKEAIDATAAYFRKRIPREIKKAKI